MRTTIEIRGARENNLKNVDVEIPRDKLIVVTGVSGSGKSSLAFDTVYAEGQRRLLASMSTFAKRFVGQHSWYVEQRRMRPFDQGHQHVAQDVEQAGRVRLVDRKHFLHCRQHAGRHKRPLLRPVARQGIERDRVRRRIKQDHVIRSPTGDTTQNVTDKVTVRID